MEKYGYKIGLVFMSIGFIGLAEGQQDWEKFHTALASIGIILIAVLLIWQQVKHT